MLTMTEASSSSGVMYGFTAIEYRASVGGIWRGGGILGEGGSWLRAMSRTDDLRNRFPPCLSLVLGDSGCAAGKMSSE